MRTLANRLYVSAVAAPTGRGGVCAGVIIAVIVPHVP